MKRNRTRIWLADLNYYSIHADPDLPVFSGGPLEFGYCTFTLTLLKIWITPLTETVITSP
jgi:hypothetical protein